MGKILILSLLLIAIGCSNERNDKSLEEKLHRSNNAIGRYHGGIMTVYDTIHVPPPAVTPKLSLKEQLSNLIDEIKKRRITIKVINTPDTTDYWKTSFDNEVLWVVGTPPYHRPTYKKPFGNAKIYCNWNTDFVIRYLKYVIYYYDKHQEYLDGLKCNSDLKSLTSN